VAILVFDIETGPETEERLRQLYAPLDPSEVKGVDAADLLPFDPEAVKYGHTTDPTKRAAKLVECRAKHQADQAAAKAKIAKALEEDWAKFVEKAPLDAIFGRIAAIGYKLPNGQYRVDGNADMSGVAITGYKPEDDLLRSFWDCYTNCLAKKVRMVGHNIFGFDLPFIIRRSRIHGVPVPKSVLEKGRYWNPIFADTMQEWGYGEYKCYVKLGLLAKGMQVGGKPEGEDECDGARFYKFFREKDERHAKAIAYLKNDLEMPWAIAPRLEIA
jgi:hypothetical protein